MLSTLDDERRCKIINIGITTSDHQFDWGPMKEAIYFHRDNGDKIVCRQYLLNANRESFFRCIRVMRRLAVRKWMDKGD